MCFEMRGDVADKYPNVFGDFSWKKYGLPTPGVLN